MSYKTLKDCDINIRQLLADGKSLKEIIRALQNEGVRATLLALQNYISENNLDDNESNPVIIPFIEVEKVKTEYKSFDFKSIKFDDFDETNDLEIVEFFQKAHLYLVVKQLEIVANEQEKYYTGESENQPIQAIHKLKLLQETLFKIRPFNVIANQSEAIKVVERMGYKLQVEENDNEEDTVLDVDYLINKLLKSGDENKVIKGLEIKRRWLETESKLKDKVAISEDEFSTNIDELSTIISRFVPAENVAELMYSLSKLNNKSEE
jgi:hypothetical protein